MQNGPFIDDQHDDLAIKHGDFHVCYVKSPKGIFLFGSLFNRFEPQWVCRSGESPRVSSNVFRPEGAGQNPGPGGRACTAAIPHNG